MPVLLETTLGTKPTQLQPLAHQQQEELKATLDLHFGFQVHPSKTGHRLFAPSLKSKKNLPTSESSFETLVTNNKPTPQSNISRQQGKLLALLRKAKAFIIVPAILERSHYLQCCPTTTYGKPTPTTNSLNQSPRLSAITPEHTSCLQLPNTSKWLDYKLAKIVIYAPATQKTCTKD
jgi:hypothetical protein